MAHDEAADASCAQIETLGSRPATTATGEQDERGYPNPLNSFVTADSSAASRQPKQKEDAAETAFGSDVGLQGAREQKGNDLLRNGEAALLRTREPVFEWGQALFHAKDYLVAATKEYRSGPAQLLRSKKPGLADFARRIKEAERQIEQQLQDDEDRHTDLIASGDWSAVISSMEHGWWLREELYGKGAPEVHDHVEELVLMLNNVAMHLVSIMSPEGNDGPAQFAWDYLCRALLLTEESSIQLPDAAIKKRLRAVALNNVGCYFERRNKLLKSLEYLDQALRLELEAEYVQDPSATHLNLCRVLSRLQRHEMAIQHARCATQILENDLIDLQEEWQRRRENMPEASKTTVHGNVTSPPPQPEDEREEKTNAKAPIEDRIKDAVAKFAVANYNAACVMEQMRCFDRALEFHRKAAEGARQAYGSDHHLTITFQQDLAKCSKIVRKHHSKRCASPSQSVQKPAERPPVYGLGFVAGPTTIVAGTRGSVRIGFQASMCRLNTADRCNRAAAKKRISLGKYSDEELRSMFDGNRGSVLGTSVFSECSRVSRRDEKHEVSFEQEESMSEISDEEDESRSADFRSIIADAIGAKKTLEPMVIQDEAGIAGFWVDRHNNTAYHVSKIGPVGSNSLAAKPGAKHIDTSADLRHLLVESSGLRGSAKKRSKEAEKSQWKNVLVADQALGGELPPMDPNRALEPERMNHLEDIASFLYEKAGPLPEFMVRLKLRVFDMHAWKTWKQRVCDEFWSEAKQMIQRTVIRNKSNAVEGGQDAPRSEAQLGARTAPPKAVNHDGKAVDDTRVIPWQDSRMLFVKLSISFQDLKETIAAELGMNAASVEIMARDLQENDYFCVASEHGLRSVFAACPGMHKSCEFFCSRPG